MGKNEKRGHGKFLLGTAIGVGLGFLFAPKSGSETRRELKQKFKDLVEKAKEIDIEEVTATIENNIAELKEELNDLDKEKVLEIAHKKANTIKVKAQELVDYAVSKGTPILKEAAEEVRIKTIKVAEEAISRLKKVEIVEKKDKSNDNK